MTERKTAAEQQERYTRTLLESDRPGNAIYGALRAAGMLEEADDGNLLIRIVVKTGGSAARFVAKHTQFWTEEEIQEAIEEGRQHERARQREAE